MCRSWAVKNAFTQFTSFNLYGLCVCGVILCKKTIYIRFAFYNNMKSIVYALAWPI